MKENCEMTILNGPVWFDEKKMFVYVCPSWNSIYLQFFSSNHRVQFFIQETEIAYDFF